MNQNLLECHISIFVMTFDQPLRFLLLVKLIRENVRSFLKQLLKTLKYLHVLRMIEKLNNR